MYDKELHEEIKGTSNFQQLLAAGTTIQVK
jgi:hypothetical protein